VLKSLAGHSKDIGMDKLATVFREAFDADIRNGYAHADYILWDDGIRLRKRNGGSPRVVSYEEFAAALSRATGFFELLWELVAEYLNSYNPAKTIRGRMDIEPEGSWIIHYDPESGAFEISGGPFG
jgi:hypothetical protein